MKKYSVEQITHIRTVTELRLGAMVKETLAADPGGLDEICRGIETRMKAAKKVKGRPFEDWFRVIPDYTKKSLTIWKLNSKYDWVAVVYQIQQL